MTSKISKSKKNNDDKYFLHELVDFKIFETNKCVDYFNDEYDLYYRIH